MENIYMLAMLMYLFLKCGYTFCSKISMFLKFLNFKFSIINIQLHGHAKNDQVSVSDTGTGKTRPENVPIAY